MRFKVHRHICHFWQLLAELVFKSGCEMVSLRNRQIRIDGAFQGHVNQVLILGVSPHANIVRVEQVGNTRHNRFDN